MHLWAPISVGLEWGLCYAPCVMALAVGLRLLKFPDLTVEGSFLLGAACAATGMRHGLPVLLTPVVAAAAGAFLGAATAWLHGWIGVNKYLAGILATAAAYTLSLRVMDQANLGLLGFDMSFAYVVGSALTFPAMWLFMRSKAGVLVRAAGANREFAEAIGLSPSRLLLLGLALTNAAAGMAGAVVATRQGFVDVSMGQGVLVASLAAMAIGERIVPATRLSLTAFVLSASFIGSLLYQAVAAVALSVGMAATDLKLATAALVVFVLAFGRSRNAVLLEDGA